MSDAKRTTAAAAERAVIAELTARDGGTAYLTTNILRNWEREKIERFARHLLGDKR